MNLNGKIDRLHYENKTIKNFMNLVFCLEDSFGLEVIRYLIKKK